MPLEITKKSDSKIQAPKFIVDFDLDEDSNFKIPYPYPNRSFFMSITGKAGSGKSSFFLNSIKSSRPPYRVYRNQFNHVNVIMPRTSFRSVEKIFEYHDEDKIHHELTGELLERLHDKIESRSEEDESTLLIIDDFSSSLRLKDVELELFKLASNRRHLRMSIMIIQHGILSLNPRLRSLMFNMAYAVGRSEEPGGRLTDRDIANAMTQLGGNKDGNIASPEIFKDVLVRINLEKTED